MHLSLLKITLLGLWVMGSSLLVDAYGAGAREDSCITLGVTHDDARPQTANPPYSITTGSAEYDRDTILEGKTLKHLLLR